MQAHAKGALVVRPQQHVAMRGLCAAILTERSVTAPTRRSIIMTFGWGSVTRAGYDLDAVTEAWDRYAGERSVCWPLE